MLTYSENYIRLFCLLLLLLFNILMGKLQITPLKFRGVRILYLKVSEFEFFPLKFEIIWILHCHFRIWILPHKF